MSKLPKFLKRYYLEIIFITPLILFILGFTLLPIMKTVVLSFQDVKTQLVSLSNYQNLLQKNSFREAIFNTLATTVIALAIQIFFGFLIALYLRMQFWGRGLMRAIVLMPMGVPTLVSGVAMIYVFSTSGYLNEVLYRLGLMQVPVDWSATKMSSILMVSVADSWKVMPIVVLLLLAGLESISRELYEAASMDGGNRWQKMWHITLPLLKSTITMTVLLRMVDLLRMFELPAALLGRVTPYLGTFAYDEYKYLSYNSSAAASTTLLALIIILVFIYMVAVERERKGGYSE